MRKICGTLYFPSYLSQWFLWWKCKEWASSYVVNYSVHPTEVNYSVKLLAFLFFTLSTSISRIRFWAIIRGTEGRHHRMEGRARPTTCQWGSFENTTRAADDIRITCSCRVNLNVYVRPYNNLCSVLYRGHHFGFRWRLRWPLTSMVCCWHTAAEIQVTIQLTSVPSLQQNLITVSFFLILFVQICTPLRLGSR